MQAPAKRRWWQTSAHPPRRRLVEAAAEALEDLVDRNEAAAEAKEANPPSAVVPVYRTTGRRRPACASAALLYPKSWETS